MYGLEIYHRVRRAVLRDGMSEREAARVFGLDRGTVSKMLRFSAPPGYRRTAQRPRSRMDAHADFVDQILISDARVRGRLHDGAGLRAPAPPGAEGGVRSAGASSGPCPGGLR